MVSVPVRFGVAERELALAVAVVPEPVVAVPASELVAVAPGVGPAAEVVALAALQVAGVAVPLPVVAAVVIVPAAGVVVEQVAAVLAVAAGAAELPAVFDLLIPGCWSGCAARPVLHSGAVWPRYFVAAVFAVLRPPR